VIDTEDVPPGAYAGLCLQCGTVKAWACARCTTCGAKSCGDRDIDSLFSEEWLHRDSLAPLGGVLSTLLEANVDRDTCYWTLTYYVKRDVPDSVLPLEIPRRMRERAEKLVIDLALPQIKVRQSPLIMPSDWDDHEAWDSYYGSWDPVNPYLGSSQEGWQLLNFQDWVNRLNSRNIRDLWMPGCGLDVLPWAYAAAGFNVVATDASKTAMEIQRSQEFHRRVVERLEELEPPIRRRLERPDSLSLRFETHDFREPLAEAAFDCIINIQAFQALSPKSMARAARAHLASLRPGGILYLSTLNVDNMRANNLERVLSEAGFLVPFELAERRHRIGLYKLGVLGSSPFAAFSIEVKPQNQRWGIRELRRLWNKRKLERLRAEYAAEKAAQEEVVDRARNDGVTKIVEVLYNTG